ncbi:MAG: hypothetical protein H0T89_00730 [Deltaproteobacteria bacterium]|nr:hypothetical protein [Deltaproteobacteria bacterium]
MKAEDLRAAFSPGFPVMFLDHLGVKYQRRGDELRTKICPTCGPRNRDAVCIAADHGAWVDQAHGCKGDIFALVAGYAGLDIKRDYPAVLKLAAQIAGVSDDGPDPDRARRIDEQRRRAEECERQARAERAAVVATMPARWASLDRGNPAGESYLLARGIDPAALRGRGDVVRFAPNGDPAVALRDLETGAIVGIQYRRLTGDTKLIAERGSQLAGSALFGRLDDIDPEGVDVAIIVEGLADTLAACLAFPTVAVFGAPGASQIARIASAVAPRIAAARGWLLLVVDNDAAGTDNASDAIVEAVRAGLSLADAEAGLDGASTIRLVDIGSHHDLADAYAAGWRHEWPRAVAS